jgi:hypothetical protein
MTEINIHYSRDIFYNIKKQFCSENLDLKTIFEDLTNTISSNDNKNDKNNDQGNSWRVTRKPFKEPPKNKEEEYKNLINSFLNKLSPKNYDTISEKILNILIESNDLLEHSVDDIFQKAVYQPVYCKQYVNLLILINANDLDINYLINQKCNIYNSMLEKETIDLSNENVNYDEFCENIKKKSYKSGFSQFIAELFNQDMISGIFIQRNINQQINKILTIVKDENINETNLENNIICLCQLVGIVKTKLDQSEILTKINEIKKNKGICKRLTFKLMDLADSLKQ